VHVLSQLTGWKPSKNPCSVEWNWEGESERKSELHFRCPWKIWLGEQRENLWLSLYARRSKKMDSQEAFV